MPAGTFRDGPSDNDPCIQFRASPSKEDIDRWNKLVKPAYKAKPQTADEKAIDRFLRTPLGRELLSKLTEGFAKTNATVTIQLDFRNKTSTGEAGDLTPPTPASEANDRTMTYTAQVKRDSDRVGGEDRTRFPTPNATRGFNYHYRDGASEMASTIYHELLHVDSLNQYDFDNPDGDGEGADPNVNESASVGGAPGPVRVGDNYGHGRGGDGARDETSYAKDFLDNLSKYAKQLDDLEQCNKRQPAPPSVPAAPAPMGGGTPR